MPAHRAPATARHRAAPASAPPPAARHRQEPARQGPARYGTVIGTVATALFIALAQAPAVERATALAHYGQGPSRPAATNLTALGSVGRLTIEVIAPPRIDPQLAAAHASRSVRRDPRGAGRQLAAVYGWTGRQWTCLEQLWTRESRWNYQAKNPSSGAYGIPQALPGEKMATAGKDWRSNPATQIRWGLRYIKGRYGSPCSAWGTFTSRGWY